MVFALSTWIVNEFIMDVPPQWLANEFITMGSIKIFLMEKLFIVKLASRVTRAYPELETVNNTGTELLSWSFWVVFLDRNPRL